MMDIFKFNERDGDLARSNNLRATKVGEYKREEELKLIERSVNTSFLALLDPKKKNEVKNNSMIMMKSNIMERTMKSMKSVIQDEQEIGFDQNYDKPFECELMVENSSVKDTGFTFWCCNTPGRVTKYRCLLSDFENNTMILQNMLTNVIDVTLNFNTVEAKLSKTELGHLHAQQTVILTVGQNFAVQFTSSKTQEHSKKSEKMISEWYQRLQNRIRRSLGVKYHIKDIQTTPYFQQNNYKLEREFVAKCQTGDILLFQGNHFFAKAQRVLTNSDFDHVGVIIRDPVYDILLYESNGNTGVCLTPWKLVVQYKWYKNVARIVWRKLQDIKRDYVFIEQFHSFVMANLNRKYHISFDKLTMTTSYIPQTKEEEGYFCSELVARVYKKLQLIAINEKQANYKPACKYFPYDFTEKAKLELVKGSLSKEYQIVFNQAVLQQDYSLIQS